MTQSVERIQAVLHGAIYINDVLIGSGESQIVKKEDMK